MQGRTAVRPYACLPVVESKIGPEKLMTVAG